MSKRQSKPRNPEDTLPVSKRVSDAIGQFGLALMTLGAVVGWWRMLSGRVHATTGQVIGMTLLMLGMLWLNVYLWRHPSKPIGSAAETAPAKPATALPPLDLRYRSNRTVMEWLLVGFTTMGVLGAGMFAVAFPLFWKISAGVGAVYVVIMYLILSRSAARKHKGIVVHIDARGIRDQRCANQGLVPWCDIHHIEMFVVRSRRQLVVWFQTDCPSRAKSGWRLHLRHVGAWADGDAGDWFIDLDDLDCRPADVERRAVHGLAAWRYAQRVSNAAEV